MEHNAVQIGTQISTLTRVQKPSFIYTYYKNLSFFFFQNDGSCRPHCTAYLIILETSLDKRVSRTEGY